MPKNKHFIKKFKIQRYFGSESEIPLIYICMQTLLQKDTCCNFSIEEIKKISEIFVFQAMCGGYFVRLKIK